MTLQTIKRASWLELFYDLAFVALIAQLTYLVADNHSTPTDWFNIFIVSYTIFILWWGTTVTRNFQESETNSDRLRVQAQMIGAFFMSLTMPGLFAGEHFGFFATLALLRLFQIVMMLRLHRLDSDNAPKTHNLLHGLSIAALLWLCSAFAITPYYFVFALAALALDVLTPLTKGKGNKVRLLNVSHMQERLGLFFLLVLGESMLVVALANTAGGLKVAEPFIVISGLLIVIAIWWVYFPYLERCAEGVRPKNLFVYLQAHAALFSSIVLLAASFKSMLKHVYPTSTDLVLYALGFVIASLAILAIRTSIHGKVRSFRLTTAAALFVNVSILCFVGLIWQQPLLAVVLSVLSTLLVPVIENVDIHQLDFVKVKIGR